MTLLFPQAVFMDSLSRFVSVRICGISSDELLLKCRSDLRLTTQMDDLLVETDRRIVLRRKAKTSSELVRLVLVNSENMSTTRYKQSNSTLVLWIF